MAEQLRTEVQTFQELRRTLRQIDRLLKQPGGFAAAALGVPTIRAIVQAAGGTMGSVSRGKLLTTDNLQVFSALDAGANGLTLLADSSETLGLRWGLMGEIPIAMRFEASAQSF